MVDNDCTFCLKFAQRKGLRWFDAELTEKGDFVVVPGVGPLTEGYVMALPRQHYRSIAEVPLDQLRVLDQLKNDIVERISSCYCPPIVFEHGTGKSRAGSCIEHAHLHLMAVKEDLLSALQARFKLRKLDGLMALSDARRSSSSYLYFEDQSRSAYFAEVEALPSQYVRRIVAEGIGRPDRWDYAAFPEYDLIRATLQRLSPW